MVCPLYEFPPQRRKGRKENRFYFLSLCVLRVFAADVQLLLVLHVELVDGVELELDLFPRLHGDLQFRAGLGGVGKNVLAFLLQLTALVTRLDAGFQRHAVGGSTGGVAPRMAERAATEL